MTLDALALHAVRDELAREMVGSRIDDAYLVDERQVALAVYARSGRRPVVVLSLRPDASAVYMQPDRPARSARVTPFALLLRKYVKGSRIVAVDQPRLERLLTFRLDSRPNGTSRRVELVAEPMGRRTNLLLVDEDGAIMDALVRTPPRINPTRPILPHLRYVPPPIESKADPTDPLLARALETAAASDGGPGWAVVVRAARGVSPLAAREAIWRTGLPTDTPSAEVPNWELVASRLRELVAPVESGGWEPSSTWKDGRLLAYAPYRLQQFPDAEVRLHTTMSKAISIAISAPRGPSRFESLKKPLLAGIAQRMEALRRKRGSLERSLAAAGQADDLRQSGEAILAHAHELAPGSASMEVEGRRIDLYPTLSPIENAQSYFRRYADARDAHRAVPPLLAEVESELDYLDEMAVHVETAAGESELTTIRRELEQAGVLRPARPRKEHAQGAAGRFAASGAYRTLPTRHGDILVGASAQGNETVTFRLARPDDLWFHARAAPGAHVVLRIQGEVDSEEVQLAAQVAAAHSAARTGSRVEVDYTRRKYVKRISGGTPGRVTYRNASTIAVRPAEE